MGQFHSVDEREARQTEINSRLAELDAEHAGDAMPEEARSEWNALNEERDTNDAVIQELRAREAVIAKPQAEQREAGAHFTTPKQRTSDIYDIASIRSESRSDEEFAHGLSENAMRSVETSEYPIGDDPQGQVERLIKRDGTGEFARRVLATSNPAYKRAFAKKMAKGPDAVLSTVEREALERTAMSTTTTAGGYAVPVTLDPTVIHSSNLSVNPWRAICRQIQITGNVWNGVSSAGVTASYDAELNEVSDDSPSFAQPTATVRMARAFVQYSIEIGEDWSNLQTEMASLFSEAKDDLEATAFLTGSGTAPNPLGILETANTAGVGTAAFVFTAGTAAFVVGDVYKLENALGARWRPRASVVANRATYNAIRQFDTAGGASLFQENLRVGLNATFPTPGTLGTNLLGYPSYEASTMSTTYATTGQLSMILGDFSRFAIIDRVGMSVEPIPHLFNTSGNLPDGRRGLFAYWRNATAVTAPLAFKILKVL